MIEMIGESDLLSAFGVVVMSTITLMRQNCQLPAREVMGAAFSLMCGAIHGHTECDKKAWRSFLRKLCKMDIGEFARVEVKLHRSTPYHRRHFAIVNAVFEAQEKFDNFEQFRDWLKVGAGWVDWCVGSDGGIVPIPRSVSYSSADQTEFERFHAQMCAFLRGQHAAPFLWPHAADPHGSMDAILMEFDE